MYILEKGEEQREEQREQRGQSNRTLDTWEGFGLLSKTNMAATAHLSYKGVTYSEYTLKKSTLAAIEKNWLGVREEWK